MKKIASFTVNHEKLLPGIYVSRKDGDTVTYDLRTRIPNTDDLMDNATMHSLEHMFATYIRNSEIADDVVYFGPMGCQTGFYLLVNGKENDVILSVVKATLEKIIAHTGDIFGKSAIECGNFRNLSLEKAKTEAKRYLDVLNSKESWDFLYE
ncbi:MAG: S-ribosylhomocysteine lyase [Ruminococcaceae bacterium]|nr:S-ribosylhomocysteine lyase [Oscillospiraceae bacterium]